MDSVATRTDDPVIFERWVDDEGEEVQRSYNFWHRVSDGSRPFHVRRQVIRESAWADDEAAR